MAAPNYDDLKLASQIPVFSGLKPQALETLLAESNLMTIRPGHCLFRQGERALAFFIIMEGWVKLFRVTPAGDEAVLNVLTKGDSFAESVALTCERYPATACAVSRAQVVVIPAEHVLKCIREIPDIAIAMIALTSQHLHRLVHRVEQLTAQSGLQRVAEFLLSLSPCAEGPCTISLPYDKSLIAGRLGLQPESLSRVFAKLRSAGIYVRASEVLVSDVAELRSLVASDRVKVRARAPKAWRSCEATALSAGMT